MKRFMTCSRLKNEYGASLAAAILFFVLCGVCASMILASASASAGKMEQVPSVDRKRFAVESAASFLRDEIHKPENAVEVTEILVEDSRKELPDSHTTNFSYAGGNEEEHTENPDDSFLISFVRSQYEPMRGSEAASPDQGKEERTFQMEISAGERTQKKPVEELTVNVTLSSDHDYQLSARITDTATPEDRPEERCVRILKIPAMVTTDTDVSVEHEEATDEEGNVIEEWTVTTTTKITEIAWRRGILSTETKP